MRVGWVKQCHTSVIAFDITQFFPSLNHTFLILLSWLGKMARSLFIFLFFFFSFRLTIHKKCGKVLRHKCYTVTVTWNKNVTVSHHMTKSHEECEKIVHRLYSSYISSVQEINENSIGFSLSTQTWRVIKSSRLSHYNYV